MSFQNKKYFHKKHLFSLLVLFLTGCSLTNLPYYPNSDFKSGHASKTRGDATMRPYRINGKTYYPSVVEIGDTASGVASWYGPNFHGKLTSNGERYNMYAMTAAHKTLPMNTIVKVTNLRNFKTTIVRINDRGPFVNNRIIDLSKSAASQIDMLAKGTAPVKLEIIGFHGKKYKKTNDSILISDKNRKQQNSPIKIELGDFMVQIGSFRKRSGAIAWQNKFNKVLGYKTVIREFNLGSEPIYRVFLVGFRSEDEARDFIVSRKAPGFFIVRDEN